MLVWEEDNSVRRELILDRHHGILVFEVFSKYVHCWNRFLDVFLPFVCNDAIVAFCYCLFMFRWCCGIIMLCCVLILRHVYIKKNWRSKPT